MLKNAYVHYTNCLGMDSLRHCNRPVPILPWQPNSSNRRCVTFSKHTFTRIYLEQTISWCHRDLSISNIFKWDWDIGFMTSGSFQQALNISSKKILAYKELSTVLQIVQMTQIYKNVTIDIGVMRHRSRHYAINITNLPVNTCFFWLMSCGPEVILWYRQRPRNVI